MEAIASSPAMMLAINAPASCSPAWKQQVQAKLESQQLACRLRLKAGKVNLVAAAGHFSGGSTLGASRKGLRKHSPYSGSAGISASVSTQAVLRWVLEPVGDGDCAHLDEKVAAPGPIEVTTDYVLVGRVAEKSDVVLPVATVSGCHARLEKKDQKLYVTDLDSTNGTWVGARRLRPGSVTEVAPGNIVTFGDEHLAKFRFTLVEAKAEE